jgi:prepilin-type processing-associated H-X9-DG protein
MPIQFACPACGKQTVVDDQFAGQTGPCAACGATITVPRASLGPMGPASGGSSGTSAMFVVLAVLGVLFLLCAGGGIAMYVGVRGKMLTVQKRVISSNNLRQIGIALHNYHDTYNELPPAIVTDTNGKPLYSGRVLLLPFLEQAALFQQFDKSKAWDSPENMAVSQVAVSVFQDPANADGSKTRSDYAFVVGPGTLFETGQKTRLSDVVDGTSNTIAVIETKTGPDNWAAPSEWDAMASNPPPGNHQGGNHVLFADGSVRFMTSQSLQANRQGLASKKGEEPVSPD